MFEDEISEAKDLVAVVNEHIADFYDSNNDSTNNSQKVFLLESVIAKTSLLIAYLIQLRYLIIEQQQKSPQSMRISLNNTLQEIKIQLDAFKTISYNFTSLLYSHRDKYKEEQNIH